MLCVYIYLSISIYFFYFFLGGYCAIHCNNHLTKLQGRHPDASAQWIAGVDASASTIGLDIGQGNQNAFLLQQWTSNRGKRLGFSGFAMFMSPVLGCVLFMVHSSFFGLKMHRKWLILWPQKIYSVDKIWRAPVDMIDILLFTVLSSCDVQFYQRFITCTPKLLEILLYRHLMTTIQVLVLESREMLVLEGSSKKRNELSKGIPPNRHQFKLRDWTNLPTHTTPKTLNQRIAGRRQGCRAWELSPVFLKGLGLKIHPFKTRYFSIAWIEPPSPDASGKRKGLQDSLPKRGGNPGGGCWAVAEWGGRPRTRSRSFLSSLFFSGGIQSRWNPLKVKPFAFAPKFYTGNWAEGGVLCL